jgi:hypothetical protein
MRMILVVMLMRAFGAAQEPSSSATAACGKTTVSFDVKRDESQHTVTPPSPRPTRGKLGFTSFATGVS